MPESEFAGPDGLWDCDERNCSQLTAALAGGVLYAQSTQAKREVQKFPDGVVVRVPPRSRIISAAHVLNTTTQPVTGHVTLRIYSIPSSAVTVKLAPFHLSYDGLSLPAHSRSRFSGECELESQYQNAAGTPLQLQMYFILPHTHALGTRFFTEIAGGPNDGQRLIDVEGFNEEARGQRYAPPVDVTGATGLRFGCEFDNPRSVNSARRQERYPQVRRDVHAAVTARQKVARARPASIVMAALGIALKRLARRDAGGGEALSNWLDLA